MTSITTKQLNPEDIVKTASALVDRVFNKLGVSVLPIKAYDATRLIEHLELACFTNQRDRFKRHSTNREVIGMTFDIASVLAAAEVDDVDVPAVLRSFARLFSERVELGYIKNRRSHYNVKTSLPFCEPALMSTRIITFKLTEPTFIHTSIHENFDRRDPIDPEKIVFRHTYEVEFDKGTSAMFTEFGKAYKAYLRVRCRRDLSQALLYLDNSEPVSTAERERLDVYFQTTIEPAIQNELFNPIIDREIAYQHYSNASTFEGWDYLASKALGLYGDLILQF